MGAFLSPIFHGSLREHYVLLVGAAGVVAMLTGFVGAWFGARFGARAAARRALRDAPRELPDVRQLRELTQGVDAIAVEVERISEAQRFMARLLADRAERQPLPPTKHREPGHITPH